MAWMRTTDTAATHDVVLAVLADPSADERSVNEVFGWVNRLYLHAAMQQSDYRVSLGSAALFGGSRTTELIDQAERAGYLTRGEDDQGKPMLVLLDDPEFIHIRTAAELQWEKQRKADNANPHLVLPVRVRDGDACRSCGRIVRFGTRDHRSKLAGTYDHRIPGQACTSPEEMVVLCLGCNSGRRDAEGRRDELFPLLPPPEKPYWHKTTISWLREPEHRRVLEEAGLKPPAALPGGARDRRAGTVLRKAEVEALKQTGIAQGPGDAAAHPARNSDPAPAPTGGANAAERREEHQPARDELQRPAAPANGSGTATCATSQGPRPDPDAGTAGNAGSSHAQEPVQRTGDAAEGVDASARATARGTSSTTDAAPLVHAAEFRPARNAPSPPPLTSGNETCRSQQIARLQDLDIPGRDGSGRDGQDRDGPVRDASRRPQGGGDRRGKRGRRRRGKR